MIAAHKMYMYSGHDPAFRETKDTYKLVRTKEETELYHNILLVSIEVSNILRAWHRNSYTRHSLEAGDKKALVQASKC